MKISTERSSIILIIKVLKPNYPGGYSKKFDTSRNEEVNGLLERGALKIMLEKDVQGTGDIMSRQFLLTIKNVEVDRKHFKAGFFVQ